MGNLETISNIQHGISKYEVTKRKKKFDLQERLIDYVLYAYNHYAVRIIYVSEQLSDTMADKHIMFQILKSNSLPAANNREAPNAESIDYIYSVR